MTKNAFKLACLKAGTQVSEQIYQFLLDLESHVTSYMKYENEYLTEQAKRIQRFPVLNKFQQNRLRHEREQGFVYVFTNKEYDSNDMYKIGKADNTKSRLSGMNTSHVFDNQEMYKVYELLVYENDKCEKYLHALFKDFRYRKEFFLVPLPLIIRVVDFVVASFNEANSMIETIVDELNHLH